MKNSLNSEVKRHKFILLVGDHYNPLGIVRSLGYAGIKSIVVLVADKSHLVAKSRYVEQLFYVKSKEEGLQLIIDKYSDEKEKPFIYTGSDDIESLLDLNYDRLIEHFYFWNAGEQGRVTATMEKKVQCDMACECGINVPKSEIVKVGELPRALAYPIMTKSVNSTMENWKCNVHICHNEEELKEVYKTIVGDNILLQEYVEKVNELCLDVISLKDGDELYIPIQVKYIRMSNSSYGAYMRYEHYAEQALFKKMQKLYKMLRYNGISCIEFLIDKNNEFHFLEVNLRNSGWSYGMTTCGENLPLIWAQSVLAGHLDTSSVSLKKLPRTGIVEPEDFFNSVKTGEITIFRWLRDCFSADMRYYFSVKDPMPFLCTVFSGVRNRIRKRL